MIDEIFNKYTEFAFIRNSLYSNNYTKELENYIDEVAQTISKKSKLEMRLKKKTIQSPHTSLGLYIIYQKIVLILMKSSFMSMIFLIFMSIC